MYALLRNIELEDMFSKVGCRLPWWLSDKRVWLLIQETRV